MQPPGHQADPPPSSPLWEAAARHLVHGVPGWYPYGVETVGRWQIPVLDPPHIDSLPALATAFDKRGKVADRTNTLLHCYVKDDRLAPQLRDPRPFVARFAGFWGVVPPDFSIRASDPLDLRVLAVRMSRAVGAPYQSRGLRVIPNLRWGDSRDFDFCFDGIRPGAAVCVSNHGCWRPARLRQGFLIGLEEMVGRLSPSIVFVHGTMDHPLFRDLGQSTRFVRLLPDRTRVRMAAA